MIVTWRSVSGAVDFSHRSTLAFPMTAVSLPSGGVSYESAVPAAGGFQFQGGSFAHGPAWLSVDNVVSCMCVGSYTYESALAAPGASVVSVPFGPKFHIVAAVVTGHFGKSASKRGVGAPGSAPPPFSNRMRTRGNASNICFACA